MSRKAVIFSLLVSMLFLQQTHCRTLEEICEKAAATDTSLSSSFCISNLKSHPHSMYAEGAREVGLMALELALEDADNALVHARGLLESSELDYLEKVRLEDFRDVYQEIVPALEDAVNDFKEERYEDVKLWVGQAMDNSWLCAEGWTWSWEDNVQPLIDENGDFLRLLTMAMAITNLII